MGTRRLQRRNPTRRAKGGLSSFLEKPPHQEQNAREQNNLKLGVHPAYFWNEVGEKQREGAIDQRKELKKPPYPVSQHQPSCPTAARIRSMPSFTFSREVA